MQSVRVSSCGNEQIVHIVIPTKNELLAERCIESIITKTTFRRYGITVITNNADIKAKNDFHGRLNIIKYEGVFNFSKVNNRAIEEGDEEATHILFLNDDTEIIIPGWLEALLECFNDDRVGVVGAKLLYPDNSIQHAGVILGPSDVSGKPGIASHWHKHLPNSWIGYQNAPHTVREVGAVTGACMMVRRDVFEKVGGFDENLAVAFNDVDLCLKVRAAGYKVMYTPEAVLYHYESFSRGSDLTAKNRERMSAEIKYMKNKWGNVLDSDPFMDQSLIPNPRNPLVRLRSFVYTRLFSKQWFRPFVPFALPLLRIKGMGF